MEGVYGDIRVVDMRDAVLSEEIVMRMARTVEGDINAKGWDQPLRIACVTMDFITRIAPGGFYSAVSLLDIPDEVARSMNYPLLRVGLRFTAESGVLTDASDTEIVTGVIVSSEAWSLSKDNPTEEDLRYAREGRLHEHPERVEARLTIAISAGCEVHIKRTRNTAPDGGDTVQVGFQAYDQELTRFAREVEEIMTGYEENQRRMAMIRNLNGGEL